MTLIYHPASLLHSLFRLEAEGIPLEKAVAMASINPAKIMGRDGSIGSIELEKSRRHRREVWDISLVQYALVDGKVVHATRDFI